MTIALPGLRLVAADVEPSYVLGFPNYCALTVAADPPNTSLSRVPAVGWQSTYGMVGVMLSRAGSTELVFQAEPGEVADPDAGVPLTKLRAGEQRRMLADLSELLPRDLEPGAYQAVISFGPDPLQVGSAPLPVTFRAATEREREVLAEVSDDVAARGSWGQWTRLPPRAGERLRLPWGADDPLRLNWILRDLYYGRDMLPSIPLERLDVLDGLFDAEREGLRAELLFVRDDHAAFSAQAARVKRDFPGLARWMDVIAAGESEIAWTRGQRGP